MTPLASFEMGCCLCDFVEGLPRQILPSIRTAAGSSAVLRKLVRGTAGRKELVEGMAGQGRAAEGSLAAAANRGLGQGKASSCVVDDGG